MHQFVVNPALPRICLQCGREVNDYQYHAPPQPRNLVNDICQIVERIEALEAEVERLKQFEWMYKDLCR